MEEYPNDAWLSWFGVLEKHGNKGYGSIIFDFFEKTAKDKGYLSIRVYTYNEFNVVIKLYTKKGMIKENYNNELELKNLMMKQLFFLNH